MTEASWHELYDDAIRQFGDTPGATLEQQLIDAYAEHPAAVQVAIDKIRRAHQNGKINSPWGAVKAEIGKQIQVRHQLPAKNQQATLERNAEQWIRSVGLHFDRWSEVADELFGDRGKLREHHTPTLEQRLQTAWENVRPAGELVEQRELERATKWVADTAAAEQRRKPAITNDDETDAEPSPTIEEAA